MTFDDDIRCHNELEGRMRRLWWHIGDRQKHIARLVGYDPLDSARHLEVAFVQAFDTLLAREVRDDERRRDATPVLDAVLADLRADGYHLVRDDMETVERMAEAILPVVNLWAGRGTLTYGMGKAIARAALTAARGGDDA